MPSGTHRQRPPAYSAGAADIRFRRLPGGCEHIRIRVALGRWFQNSGNID